MAVISEVEIYLTDPLFSPPFCVYVSVVGKFLRNLVPFNMIFNPNREIKVSRNALLSISRN